MRDLYPSYYRKNQPMNTISIRYIGDYKWYLKGSFVLVRVLGLLLLAVGEGAGRVLAGALLKPHGTQGSLTEIDRLIK